MRVLVACEFSGTVRDAFLRAGHSAISCDFRPSERPGEHYQGDVRDLLRTPEFDLMIGHPTCRYLANSGVRWLYTAPHSRQRNESRWEAMREGAAFFRELLNARIPRVAIENPVMHGHAQVLVGGGPDQTVQPWMFGDGETKAVCLWLRNLPLLVPTCPVPGRTARVHRMAPGPEREKERSRFFIGIADAMAGQWGAL